MQHDGSAPGIELRGQLAARNGAFHVAHDALLAVGAGLALALEELGFFADYRILGVYRSAPWRETMKEPASRSLRPQIRGM